MGRIHVLPPSLVNKIAAGEVIERPASVLKELIENSLDGGASRIDIAIEGGGKGLVRVADDGIGMDEADLALAVQPHATSKLADESDLFALHTMGFRGEALASIAAVSQMRVVTRPADSDQAFSLDVNGGQTDGVKPAAGDRGTVVEVRNLFHNTPARRKFLKAESTEFGHVTEALARVALAHTDVAFRMTHNGKLAYELPATEPAPSTPANRDWSARLAQRIGDFFGSELAATLLPVELAPTDDQTPAIRGLIGPPQHSRPSPRWQYVFLNGRYIRDRFIQHALREAYRGLIEPSRQPVVFLFLLMPPELVDFNVHPTKIEVRFADSNRVHSAVLRCLRDKLTRTDLTAAGQAPAATQAADAWPDEPAAEDEQARQRRIHEAMAEFLKRSDPIQRRFAFQPTPPGARQPEFPPQPSAPAPPQAPPPPLDEFPGPQREGRPQEVHPRPGPATPESGLSSSPSPQPAARGAEDLAPGPLAAVQIHHAYLVAECDDGLLIVDQHALHERIVYEDLLARVRDPNGRGLGSQRLLIPPTVYLGEPQAALLLEQEELLRQLGVELTAYGPGQVAVCAFPALLERVDPGQFVRDLADRLADEPPAGPEAFIHQALDMMACKAAVKAGQPLTPSEIDALLARRHLVERATNCPHGRPTALKFTLAELEKQFKRR